MSNKKQPIFDHRLSVGVSAQMSARLDTLADIRNVPKAELAREALRSWLDEAEDARMSRAFFTKSFQRRIDHLDWQFEVLMQMVIALAGGKPELLDYAMEKALQSDMAEVLHNGGLRRSAQNRKPPAK